jgi:hypothetical protein
MTMTDESVRLVADRYISRDGTSPVPDGAKLSVDDLCSKAKTANASGIGSFHDAAEYIATAQWEGATQRAIAAKVGKSAAWVNRLLAWRNSGFIGDAAFSSQSRKKHVQRAEQKAKPTVAGDRGRTEAPPSDTAQEGQKQRSNVNEPNFDWAWFQNELENVISTTISDAPRDVLVKMLGMLGSAHDGEVLAAARAVEKQRLKLGLTWDQLISSLARVQRLNS